MMPLFKPDPATPQLIVPSCKTDPGAVFGRGELWDQARLLAPDPERPDIHGYTTDPQPSTTLAKCFRILGLRLSAIERSGLVAWLAGR
jgi:hypothetical protein